MQDCIGLDNPLNPMRDLQNHTRIIHKGDENKGNDHQLMQLLIVNNNHYNSSLYLH